MQQLLNGSQPQRTTLAFLSAPLPSQVTLPPPPPSCTSSRLHPPTSISAPPGAPSSSLLLSNQVRSHLSGVFPSPSRPNIQGVNDPFLEDAVRNIYTVVAFCAGNKVMELYRFQLNTILKQSFVHGVCIGVAFGFSQFLLFSCNALLLWFTAVLVKDGVLEISTVLKEYMIFTFATFALVEPFGSYA